MQFDLKGLFDMIEQRIGRRASTGLLLIVVLALCVVGLGIIFQGIAAAYGFAAPIFAGVGRPDPTGLFASWEAVLTVIASVIPSLGGTALFWGAYRLFANVRARRALPVDGTAASGRTDGQPFVSDPAVLASTHIWGRTIRVTDLVDQTPPSRLRGRTFEDCILVGPVVLAISDEVGTQFIHNTFVGGIDAFMHMPPRRLIGVVGVERCVFRRCNFLNVGIIATPELVERFLVDAVRPPAPPRTSD